MRAAIRGVVGMFQAVMPRQVVRGVPPVRALVAVITQITPPNRVVTQRVPVLMVVAAAVGAVGTRQAVMPRQVVREILLLHVLTAQVV